MNELKSFFNVLSKPNSGLKLLLLKIVNFFSYISMNIEPNGRIPPRRTMTNGSMNHFFSGIGLGTALILENKF